MNGPRSILPPRRRAGIPAPRPRGRDATMFEDGLPQSTQGLTTLEEVLERNHEMIAK